MLILQSFMAFLHQSTRKHPIELLLSLGFSIAALWIPREGQSHLGAYFTFFPFYFTAAYLSRSSPFYWFSLLYILAGFVLVFLVGQDSDFYFFHEMYWGAIFIHLILLLVKDFRFNNKQMIYSVVSTATHLGVSIVLAGVAIIMVVLLKTSIAFLFDYSFDKGMFQLGLAIFLLGTPLFFLFFEDREAQNNPNREGQLHLVGEILINFILSPALILYTLIVYAYLISILVDFELPRGNVSFVVVPYISLGILCIALRSLLEKPKWQYLYHYFNYLAIMPLGLLWLGIYQRIAQYGLTESRIYLLSIAILISLFVLCSFSQRLLQYRLFSALSIAMIVGVTMILSPKKLEQESQYARFITLAMELDILDEQQKLKPEIMNAGYQLPVMDNYTNRELSETFLYYVKGNQDLEAFYGKEQIERFADLLRTSPNYFGEAFDGKFLSIERENGAIDISSYQTLYIRNDTLAFKDPKNQPIYNRILVLKDPYIEIHEAYFKRQFDALGIDLSKPLNRAQLEQIKRAKDKFLYVPTLDNKGLVLLNTLHFVYRDDDGFTGYDLEVAVSYAVLKKKNPE